MCGCAREKLSRGELLFRRDNFFQAPILMKRDFVEKAKSGYGDED
jgi:hypothetical protein